jgi:glycerophosphoryl diester phosphodiesterase
VRHPQRNQPGGSHAAADGKRRRPAISAHRGGSEHAPAQTWPAFQAAVASGVEYIEFDVRRCADGELVAHHDERVRKTGPAVHELRYSELCALAGHQVPRVPEVMTFIAPHATGHVDLKEVGYEAQVASLALDTFGPDRFLISSREDASLDAIHRFEPGVRTGLSLGQRVLNPSRLHRRPRPREDCSLRRIFSSGCAALVINHWLAKPSLLRNCVARNMDVLIWTVNDVKKIAGLLTDDRVTAVITDRPERALGIRAGLPA